MTDNGTKNNNRYRYIEVVIGKFSNNGSVIALKKTAQTTAFKSSGFIQQFYCRSNLFETDDGKEFVAKVFTCLPISKDVKRFSRYTSKGTVFAESFGRKICGLLNRASL